MSIFGKHQDENSEAKPAEEDKRPLELLAEESGREAWVVAAAKAGKRWSDGQMLTKSEFDAALDEVAHLEIRGT